MTEKTLYALSACFFAGIAMVGVLVFGGEQARQLIIWSALIAAWSQFAAQDYRARVPSIILAYVSMGLAAWAVAVL